MKSQKQPELDSQCIEYAAQCYSVLRQKAAYSEQNKISCPVTVRTLETMIRIATAHSKIRIAKTVTTKDIDVAMNLLHLSIFGCHLDEDEEEQEEMVDDNVPLQDRKGVSKSRMEIDQGNDSRAKKNVKFDQEDEFKANGSIP